MLIRYEIHCVEMLLHRGAAVYCFYNLKYNISFVPQVFEFLALIQHKRVALTKFNAVDVKCID